MDPQIFEQVVIEVLADLPQEFKDKLVNVEVVIEDLPSFSQLTSLGLRHPLSLFGLYQGIPQTKRPNNYTFVPPDKITIFRLPIITFYRTDKAIRQKIKAVVLHEIGHHFGMTEADLARRPKAQ